MVRAPAARGDRLPDLLEIPAGKLDEEGEDPLETAKRELAEEIGKQAEHWEPLGAFYTSPGFTDEQLHLFLATGLSDVDERPEVHENERIDVEIRPLSRPRARSSPRRGLQDADRASAAALRGLTPSPRAERRRLHRQGAGVRRRMIRRRGRRRVAPSRSSTSCSTSSPTSSSSAGSRATRSRRTAPTCCSSARTSRTGATRSPSSRTPTSRSSSPRSRPGRRAPAGRARDPAAQGRLPALLLPPPAAPGQIAEATRPRSLHAPAPEPQAPAGALARRGREAARAAQGHRARRAARPRAAGDHVRLRPARLRGDRPRGRRRRPRGRHPARPRQGLQGAARPGRLDRRPRARRLPAARARPKLAGDRLEPRLFLNHRGNGLTRQGLYKIVQRHARTAGLADRR